MELKIAGIVISQAAFFMISLCVKSFFSTQTETERALKYVVCDMLCVLNQYPMPLCEMLSRYTGEDCQPINGIFKEALLQCGDKSLDYAQRLLSEGQRKLGVKSSAYATLLKLTQALRETDRKTMISKLRLIEEALENDLALREAKRQSESAAYTGLIRLGGAMTIILFL
ncbi:MAG: hypothetical protein GX061_08325 [Eubacteriaceae bacterium]|nr:hypothetical protein [Eubacteriaceae bacterium]